METLRRQVSELRGPDARPDLCVDGCHTKLGTYLADAAREFLTSSFTSGAPFTPSWIALVQYALPGAQPLNAKESPHKHLLVSADPDKGAERKKNRKPALRDDIPEWLHRMFSITGIPCGASGYILPLGDELMLREALRDMAPLPPVVLAWNVQDSSLFEDCWRLDVSGPTNFATQEALFCSEPEHDGTLCDTTCKRLSIRSTIPHKHKTYIEAVLAYSSKWIHLGHTATRFYRDYPANKPANGSDWPTSEWVALFLPGQYFRDFPFAWNGLLIAGDGVPTSNDVEKCRTWMHEILGVVGSELHLTALQNQLPGLTFDWTRGDEGAAWTDFQTHLNQEPIWTGCTALGSIQVPYEYLVRAGLPEASAKAAVSSAIDFEHIDGVNTVREWREWLSRHPNCPDFREFAASHGHLVQAFRGLGFDEMSVYASLVATIRTVKQANTGGFCALHWLALALDAGWLLQVNTIVEALQTGAGLPCKVMMWTQDPMITSWAAAASFFKLLDKPGYTVRQSALKVEGKWCFTLYVREVRPPQESQIQVPREEVIRKVYLTGILENNHHWHRAFLTADSLTGGRLVIVPVWALPGSQTVARRARHESCVVGHPSVPTSADELAAIVDALGGKIGTPGAWWVMHSNCVELVVHVVAAEDPSQVGEWSPPPCTEGHTLP